MIQTLSDLKTVRFNEQADGVIILDQTLLPLVPKSCLCIDLASKPGGIDLRAAEQLELETIWALGLPGKVAPGSAGQAIVDTVLQILTEQEVSL